MTRLAPPTALLAVALAPLSLAAGNGNSPPTELTNGLVTLRFDAEDPDLGLVLESVGDVQDVQAFALERRALWQLEIRDPVLDGPGFLLEPDRSLGTAFKFDVKHLNDGYWYSQGADDWTPEDNEYELDGDESSDDVGLRFRYRNVTHPDLPGGGKYDVDVRVVLPADKPYATFEFKLRSKGGADGQVLKQRFPQVSVVGGPNPASERLTIPFWQGSLFENPINNVSLNLSSQFLPAEVHPGPLNMQWLAYYDETDPSQALLYWGTCDNDGYPKGFRIDPRPLSVPPTLDLSIEHVPEGNGGAGIDDRTPYPFTLGVLRGDWYDAARFYREDWALQQPGPNKGTILENPDYSQTVREADMIGLVFMGNCPAPPACAGLIPNTTSDKSNWNFAATHLSQLQDYFETDEVIFQMYNWDANSFARNTGQWFPASPNFLNVFAPQAAALGITWAPYFFTPQLSTATVTYQNSDVPGFLGRNAADFSVQDANGGFEESPRTYCPQAEVCDINVTPDQIVQRLLDEGTPFVSAYTLDNLTRLQSETLGGASGAYLDVFQSNPRVSYNPAPALEGFHPVGGGSYWTAGRRQLLHDLKGEFRGELGVEDYFVLAEAPYEPLIGEIEFTYGYHGGFRTVDGSGAVVPLFQTVYHDYQRTGSILTLDVNPSLASLLFNPNIWQASRQVYAANLWMGHAPYCTTTVTPLTWAQRTNPLLLPFPFFQEHLEMARRYVNLLKRDEVRELVVFGERLRAPETDSGRVFAGNFFATNLNPLEEDQPAVYTALFGTPGEDGQLGLLVMNWTDGDDPFIDQVTGQILYDPTQFVPGAQNVRVTMSREEYGLAAQQYRVREFVAGAAGPTEIAAGLDFSQPEAFLDLAVPERTARFFLIDRVPPTEL